MVRHFTDGTYQVYQWIGFTCQCIGIYDTYNDAKQTAIGAWLDGIRTGAECDFQRKTSTFYKYAR